jgi:signal transduction histidine kinase
MSIREARRQAAHKALLDIFSSVTGLPIGLFEISNEKPLLTISDGSLRHYEGHCQLIQQFPGGAALCEQDQCMRADAVITTQQPELSLCYAGLYNQAIPINIRGEIRGVLIYGEMLIEGEQYLQNSLNQHETAVQTLQLTPADAVQLREKLLAAKRVTPERLEEYKTILPKIEQWFDTLIQEEDRQKRNLDQVTHDMQTRLQAVIAYAENLVHELPELSIQHARDMAQDLFLSALALDTLIQNLGQYLEDYRFQKRSLAGLVSEAKAVYQAEAARRGIEIRVRLEDVHQHPLEISRPHLQHALNNLIHNAVKYSFRSGPGRQRFVQIKGEPLEEYYALEIQNYGVGILPDEIIAGKIFEDGYQGKLTEGEYRTGSGKGLSFVKRVIAAHHGEIEVESQMAGDEDDPEGQPHLTRFTIYLPFIQP